jgi:hypothetical protein
MSFPVGIVGFSGYSGPAPARILTKNTRPTGTQIASEHA